MTQRATGKAVMAAGPTIGVLAPLLAGEYFGALISGIRGAVAERHGRVIAIQTMDTRLGDIRDTVIAESDLAAKVAWEHIDGFVALVGAVGPAYLHAIGATGKPLVTVSEQFPGLECPVVGPDNRIGASAAVSHLLAHGHTRIAFAGHLGQLDINERYEAYQDTLRAHGIEPDPRLLYATSNNHEGGGERAAKAMLAAGLPSTAVMVATDFNALGLIQMLIAAGAELPRDQAIIGFDNTRMGAQLRPTLSSVSQHFAHTGAQAARLVFDKLAGLHVAAGRHPVATSLVIRESCGCSSSELRGEPAEGGLEGARHRFLANLLGPSGAAGASTPDAAESLARAAAHVIDAFVVAARGGLPLGADARTTVAIEQILRNCPTSEKLTAAAASLVAELVANSPPDEADEVARRLELCVLTFTVSTLEAQLRAQHAVSRELRSSLRNEYDLSMDLLRREEAHPRALAWLSRTHIEVACLALWSAAQNQPAHPGMQIVGVYDGTQRLPELVGATCREGTFPPRSVLATVDGSSDVVFIFPVRTLARDWGFLAVVGPVETNTDPGRETYFQWAELLSVALDHEAVLESLRSQGEDLAAGFDRERELVEGIRVSEERYALAARAANDGLWDWNLFTGSIYFSARWKAMLGYPEESIAGRPDEWLDRVHPDDLPGLVEHLESSSDGVIASFEYEHRVRARSGEYRWQLCRALAVPGGNEPTQRLVGSLTDVTDRKELEDRLRQDALYDGLTGLPNRVLFLDRLERAITHSRRRADYNFVVLFLDLDGFKPVNDTLGHLAGDNLLKGVAARISGQLRESDTAARFGGDEFAVLLNDVADLDDVPVIVSRLQAALAEPYELDESVVVVSASIGIATSATGYEFPEDVLRDSDIAMYRAKAAERGTYATFDVSMHQRAVTRMRLESDLRQAVERREFELYYQPIYALGTHRIHALEALVRWRHPERGIISPGEFLPVAEETGLMVSLGALIIEEVCRQRAQWAADGAPMDDVRISVNISNREFWHANFQPHLEASLEAYDVLPAWLNLEITEGVIMHNPDAAQSILSDLRRWGFELHIDDFGTGYSSLDALHRFPVEALKIDRSFVARLETDARSRELVRTITMMGRSLDMEVIAEGIETVAQEGILSDLGCESGQGYLFSRPVPAAEVEALLVRSRAGAGPPVAARRH